MLFGDIPAARQRHKSPYGKRLGCLLKEGRKSAAQHCIKADFAVTMYVSPVQSMQQCQQDAQDLTEIDT